MSVCLSVCLSMCFSVCVSVLSVCIIVCLSVCFLSHTDTTHTHTHTHTHLYSNSVCTVTCMLALRHVRQYKCGLLSDKHNGLATIKKHILVLLNSNLIPLPCNPPPLLPRRLYRLET